ncbi:MAG: beta-galactosidase [Bacteroides sp.]|nr:beta-galactosidase [Bacteroides sp.]
MLEIKERFYLDNKPFKIISGSIHYFRTVPEYWRDRLEKLKAMGCNTAETYIPWNFHEPVKGKFIWDGMRDICRFIELAGELGLYMIIRPSPYICAEWEFGGLPSWLLKDRNMRLRCCYQPYLDHVSDYYDALIPRLVPYQADRGGNIILMQLENEYGYYGDDTAYLECLRDKMRSLGVTVPFITSDGPWSGNIFKAGCVEGALPTGNFGSSCDWQFGELKKLIGENKPLMCTEFWVGWFDFWGSEEHKTSDLEKNKADLDYMLANGNVNFYMFLGGTDFGFMNGSNYDDRLTPDVTSYDYDAPLTEDGRITEKYMAFREVIGKYNDLPPLYDSDIKRGDFGCAYVTEKTDLFSVLDRLAEPIITPYPLSMEETDQDTGYILYRTSIRSEERVEEIRFDGAGDRISAYENQRHIFTAYDRELLEARKISSEEKGAVYNFLVENMGRVNFGHTLEEQRKGIVKALCVNGHRHYGFEIYNLPLDEEQIERLDYTRGYRENLPAFYRLEFEVNEPADTFIDFSGFGKGCIFINGFNLGRFWEIGPQKSLYLPAPLLKKGKNILTVFETEGKAADRLRLRDEPLPYDKVDVNFSL